MIYTKIVVGNTIYNFAVDKFFIWKYFESQIFILDLIFSLLNFQTILDGHTPCRYWLDLNPFSFEII
jgi:hypothetical protein